LPDIRSIEQELKELIVDSLSLEEIRPEDIDSEAAIFVDGLGLDSIDALELGLVVSRKWGISMGENPQENREHFASVAALARFVQSRLESKA
jgi:acyl carrier protein